MDGAWRPVDRARRLVPRAEVAAVQAGRLPGYAQTRVCEAGRPASNTARPLPRRKLPNVNRRAFLPADLAPLSGCAAELAEAFVSLSSDIALVIDEQRHRAQRGPEPERADRCTGRRLGRPPLGRDRQRRYAPQDRTDARRPQVQRRGAPARDQPRRRTRRRRAGGFLGPAAGPAGPGAGGGQGPARGVGSPAALSRCAAGAGARLLAGTPGGVALPAAVPGGHRRGADGGRAFAARHRRQPCRGQPAGRGLAAGRPAAPPSCSNAARAARCTSCC